MRKLTSYRGYLYSDPRFFDEFGRADLPYTLEKQVRALAGSDRDVTVNGVWVVCHPAELPPVQAHGWKIHVSATPDTAALALELVGKEFLREPFHFKSLRDRAMVEASTSRWWPTGQVGKFIAIYPRDAEACRMLLQRLYPLLADVHGPYILTDRRYLDSRCLYYRYGEFRTDARLEPDGSRVPVLVGPDGEEWVDDRLPVYRRPPWVPELFEDPAVTTATPAAGDGQPAAGSPRMLRGYRMLRALNHNGSGGVYLAERVADGVQVVLKEARPHTGFAADGSDGQERLRREFDALTLLADTGIAPRPYELFEEWEHLFLVQEFIDAMPFMTFLASRSPLAHGDMGRRALEIYRAEVAVVLDGVRAAIKACHDRGIGHGDVSFTNLFVHPDTLRVWLLDFESSQPLEGWRAELPATPGFVPRNGSDALRDGRAFDQIGVASIELATISPRNLLRTVDEPALARSTVHSAALLKMPVGDLLQRLELPADPDTTVPDLGDTVRETVRFIESVMTVDRPDRTFPADPQVFNTNPWSVAYGAAGVAWSLQRLTGTIPDPLRDRLERAAGPSDRLPPGLCFGLAGVGWSLLNIGLPRGRELLDRALAADLGPLPADVATGVAGLGLASLAGWRLTGAESYREQATRFGEHLISTAQDSGTGLSWPVPGERAHPNGYAYGSAGVSAFLLYLHQATGEQRFLRFARRALDFEVHQLMNRADGGVWLPGRVGSRTFEPYWERGGAGLGGVLARFCLITGDEVLRDRLDRLASTILAGSPTFTGLYMGTAGVVNFALDCHHLLGDAWYRERAEDLATIILALRCVQPEGIVFPGHGLLRYSTDFATGSAGVALVLERLRTGGPDNTFTLDDLLPVPHRSAEVDPNA